MLLAFVGLSEFTPRAGVADTGFYRVAKVVRTFDLCMQRCRLSKTHQDRADLRDPVFLVVFGRRDEFVPPPCAINTELSSWCLVSSSLRVAHIDVVRRVDEPKHQLNNN